MKTYREWQESLNRFKEASHECTWKNSNLEIKPADASKGTVEIRDMNSTTKLHIFVVKADVPFLIDALVSMFELE